MFTKNPYFYILNNTTRSFNRNLLFADLCRRQSLSFEVGNYLKLELGSPSLIPVQSIVC
jgi:hypothetical protein